MQWQVTTSVLLCFLSGVVTLVTAWMAWRQRLQRGVVYLAQAMIFTALWCFSSGLEAMVVSPDLKFVILTFEYVESTFFVLLLFFFVIEYHNVDAWFTPLRRRVMWLPSYLLLFLTITNSRHHLIWTGYVAGPPGSNQLVYLHGPAYELCVSYFVSLVIVAIGILIHQARCSQGWARQRSVVMALSLLCPVATSGLYVLAPGSTLAIDLLPVGFALAGFLISVSVFQDVVQLVELRTTELSATIHDLQVEVEGRRQAEKNLRSMEQRLAERVAKQSRSLTGLYEVIILAGQSLSLREQQEKILARIIEALSADAGCIHEFDRDNRSLRLVVQTGLSADAIAHLADFPPAWLLQDMIPVTVNDIANSSGIPDAIRSSGLGAHLGVPLLLLGRVTGTLSMFWNQPRSFSVEEIALFNTMADQLGIIIENTRLHQRSEEAAAIRERRRLARDLHDSVTQSLHSLVLSTETASNRLKQGKLDLLEASLQQQAQSARQAVKEMRLLLFELRLATLDEVNLVEALQTRLDAVERRAGVQVESDIQPLPDLPRSVEKELYCIVMEALNNSLKHARAAHLTVHLCPQGRGIELDVRDDGRGFEPYATRIGGMGLHSMSERAERLGGNLTVTSAPGMGTRIHLLVKEIT
jgi:signal transduction histidine kinase